MNPKCLTVQRLKQIAAVERPQHSDSHGVAASALRIISDIDEEKKMTSMDIVYLGWLVGSFFQQERDLLFSFLRDESPDCEICAALAVEIGALLAGTPARGAKANIASKGEAKTILL